MNSDNQSASQPQAHPNTTTTVHAPNPARNNHENNALPPPATTYNMSFPPFPSTQGRFMIPYSNFLPKGLALNDSDADDEDDSNDHALAHEIDGEGVRTIALGVTHDLDRPKSKKKKSLQRRVYLDPVTGKPIPRTWFEQWEDNELSMTATRLDPSRNSHTECLLRADEDFSKRRYFPIPVRQLYDEWRTFIGLLDVVPKTSQYRRKRSFPKRDEKAQESGPKPPAEDDYNADADEEGNYSDDVPEDDEEERPVAAPKQSDFPSFALSEPPPPVTSFEDDNRDYEGELESIKDRGTTLSAEARMEQFFLDPALAVKCFLSHEYQNRGLYWLEFNLKAGPIIVASFLEFLIRHSLIHEEYSKSLKEAVLVARHAVEELPRTKKVAMALRDKWGTVCVDLWGSRESIHWGVDDTLWGPAPGTTDDEGYITEVPVVAELIEANGAPVNADGILDELQAAVSKLSVEETQATEENKEAPVAAGDEGAPPSPAFDNPYEKDVEPTWEAAEPPPNLFQFVGCSTFPLTHAPARAERSYRQILRIDPPKDLLTSTHANPISLLHGHLALLVLGPWEDPQNGMGDIPPPEMLRMETVVDSDEPRPDYVAQFWKPHEPGFKHDPLKDEISVFIDPALVDTLKLGAGMGVSGIFVQVAKRLDAPIFPVPPAVQEGQPQPQDQKKKKPYYNNRPHNSGNAPNQTQKVTPFDGRSWWYLDSVNMIIPSFWTETSQLPNPPLID